MNALIADPIVVSVASGLLAILAGAIGFTFRVIQTHSKPMARVLSFSNDALNSSDTEELTSETLARINKLKTVAFSGQANWTIRNVSEQLSVIQRWTKAATEFKADVDAYLQIPVESPALDGKYTDEQAAAIREIISYVIFDGLLVATIGKGILRIPKPDMNLEPALAVRRSNERKGCYFVFAPDPIAIGKGLNDDPAQEHFFKDIATLIGNAEHQKLRQTFLLLSETLQIDLPNLKDLQREFDLIIQSHAIYTAKLYFANLTSAPILIEPTGMLCVDGAKTTRGGLTAHVNFMTLLGSGQGESQAPVEDAVVVPAGGDVRLLAYTRPSGVIEHGKMLNVLFSDGSAVAKVVLRSESVGLFRRKAIVTPAVPFHSSKQKGPFNQAGSKHHIAGA